MITFPIKGPTEGSFALELQTSTFSIFCPLFEYDSVFYPVPVKMMGSTLTVSVPLGVF